MRVLRRWLAPRADSLSLAFVKRGGWVARAAQCASPPSLPIHDEIERLAERTNGEAGERPLWEGYRDVAGYPRSTVGGRTPDQVRTDAQTGRFYSCLAAARGNPVVVEFGTAFGVSGMYWLAGIGSGHLYTFEPNRDWAETARRNLAAVADRFTLTVDTFEAAGPAMLPARGVDIAFVDAIHTGAFVERQYALLRPLMKEGGLVLFDDIAFWDDMQACWRRIASEPGLAASLTLGDRVGVVELR
jgi:predicted O-methyltransferase YrrM